MVFKYRIWCLERIPLWTAECRWCFHLVSWFIVFAVSICNPCGWDGSPNLMVKAGWANPQHSATLVRNHNMAVLAVFPPWVFLNITTFPTFKQWPANLGQTQMLGVISSQCNLLFRGTYCSCRRWLTLAIDIVCRCTSSVLQVEAGSLRIEWLLHRLLPQIWNLLWRQV
jgi:hypothetical protein